MKATNLRRAAQLFSAIGDETRLALLARLAGGVRRSIADLSSDATVTRQAITKHLQTLERAGLIKKSRHGRESLFELQPQTLETARQALERISQQWEGALGRLKQFVERE